jgi:hypothetical protein
MGRGARIAALAGRENPRREAACPATGSAYPVLNSRPLRRATSGELADSALAAAHPVDRVNALVVIRHACLLSCLSKDALVRWLFLVRYARRGSQRAAAIRSLRNPAAERMPNVEA